MKHHMLCICPACKPEDYQEPVLPQHSTIHGVSYDLDCIRIDLSDCDIGGLPDWDIYATHNGKPALSSFSRYLWLKGAEERSDE